MGDDQGNKNRSALVRGKDGILSRGPVVAKSNKEGEIRKRGGAFLPGEKLGEVDEHGNIRKPGFIFRGPVVGEIHDRAAFEKTVFFPAQKWGYVDEAGNVRQRDGVIFRGRIIGTVKGNPEAALGYFVLRFQEIAAKVETLEKELEAVSDKAHFLDRVRRMLEWVPEAEALGDFDGLLRRLRHLEARAKEHLDRNLHLKTKLCEKAESLSRSTNWSATAETLKKMQGEWKTIGYIPREHNEELWNRFRRATDSFFERRKEHFSHLEKERQANYEKKLALCSRAEGLARSSDWKAAGEALKALQTQWKAIGPVPREQTDALWERFRSAQDEFYRRRSEYFEQRDRERDRKQQEWRERMRGSLEYKREKAKSLRESIEHDLENIDRWRDTISSLRPGGRAEEIRDSLMSKISDVQDRIDAKRERLSELLASIRDIESKLH